MACRGMLAGAHCAREGAALCARGMRADAAKAYFFGKEVDAKPSCVGYCVQEFLVASLFAFLHVMSIFFGLFVDTGRWSGNAPAVE